MMWLPISAMAPAPPRRVQSPGPGRSPVDHEILGMDAAEAPDLAEFATLDHLARQGQHRIADVVEAHLGHDACALRRLHHRECLICGRCQRLLAINRLARGERRQRDRRMQLVRCGDVHHIHRRVIHQGAPIADRAREPVAGGGGRRQLVRGVGQQLQHGLQSQVEDAADAAKPKGMGAAHEAGPQPGQYGLVFSLSSTPWNASSILSHGCRVASS